ncbi:MAG: hypothetical protein RSC49_02135 [Clostridium sp.]
MKKISYQWVIFHMDNKYFSTINNELKDKGYKHIKAVIPTVSILRKRQKGKDIYEEVPILFSYGFMKMPTEKAYSRRFLTELRKNITGIHSFVKSLETMHPGKLRKRVDNAEDFDDFSIVATVSASEVRRFRRLSKQNKKYTQDSIINLEIGSYVVLRGYPFEGVSATVLDVNLTEGTVKLLLYPEGGKMQVKLPLENAIYSIYHDYNEEKLYSNQRDFNPNDIMQEDIDTILEKRQY